MTTKELGKKLAVLRSENHLTIEEVAYAVEESIDEVELWESGQIKPYEGTMVKLSFLYSDFEERHSELKKANEENYYFYSKHPVSNIVPKNFSLWLKAHGFFAAPASLSHHGNKSGCLFTHALAVTAELVRYTKELHLSWGSDNSPWLVGIFHDLCKIDDYAFNFESGEWEWNKQQKHTGHGEKSVIMLQKHIKLDEQEIACIRWHMGAFTNRIEWDYYGRAVEQYPTVLFTHTADMYASRVLGV